MVHNSAPTILIIFSHLSFLQSFLSLSATYVLSLLVYCFLLIPSEYKGSLGMSDRGPAGDENILSSSLVNCVVLPSLYILLQLIRDALLKKLLGVHTMNILDKVSIKFTI